MIKKSHSIPSFTITEIIRLTFKYIGSVTLPFTEFGTKQAILVERHLNDTVKQVSVIIGPVQCF